MESKEFIFYIDNIPKIKIPVYYGATIKDLLVFARDQLIKLKLNPDNYLTQIYIDKNNQF